MVVDTLCVVDHAQQGHNRISTRLHITMATALNLALAHRWLQRSSLRRPPLTSFHGNENDSESERMNLPSLEWTMRTSWRRLLGETYD